MAKNSKTAQNGSKRLKTAHGSENGGSGRGNGGSVSGGLYFPFFSPDVTSAERRADRKT